MSRLALPGVFASLSISFHSSSSPSPVTAETGSTGCFKHGFEFPQRADPFAARELVDLGRDDVPRDVQPPSSHRAAADVWPRPGCRESTSSMPARPPPEHPSAMARTRPAVAPRILGRPARRAPAPTRRRSVSGHPTAGVAIAGEIDEVDRTIYLDHPRRLRRRGLRRWPAWSCRAPRWCGRSSPAQRVD